MKWWERRKKRGQLKAGVRYHEGTLELLKTRKENFLMVGDYVPAAEQDQRISWQTKRLEEARRELQEFERKEG